MEASNINAGEIGLRIKGARDVLGLSVADFARKLGVEQRTLYRLERGLNVPSVTTVAAIALVAGTTSQWVIHGEGEGPVAPAPSATSAA